MQHIREEDLEACAQDPGNVAHRDEIEAHLAACERCRLDLKFERACRDAVTWFAAGAVRGEDADLARLVELAERSEAEDREAAAILGPFLAEPLRFIWTDIATDERVRTAGGVRILCAEANRQCQQNPRHALRLADAATFIAGGLSPDEHYLGGNVYLLRGLAWKERANALRYRGNLRGALEAIDRADREYDRAPIAILDRAILKRMRAITLAESEQFADADACAQEAADTFAACGDLDRYIQARNDQANIAFYRGDFPAAVDGWNATLPLAEQVEDHRMVAAISLNAAHGCLAMNDTMGAAPHLHRSLILFEQLGLATEVLRARWGLAYLLLVEGKAEEAARRLGSISSQFERLGAATDALLVTLDHADALLVLGRFDTAGRICKGLVRRFKDLGLTNAALRALGYLREMAVQKRLARPHLRHVRRFVERLQRNPALVFAPPER